MKEHQLPHCEYPDCSRPRVKGLHKIHHFLCEKSSHYHSWHHHKHHRKTHYSVLVIYLIAIFAGTIFTLFPNASKAATSFQAQYDSASLDADYGLGSTTASNDGTPATLTTGNGGYGGTGEAVTVAQGQTLKYEVSNNLNTEKAELNIKFQAPFTSTGADPTTGFLNYAYGVAYDSASEFLYISDTSNNRIVKTKFDGTGWKTYGTGGSGKGQFSGPRGIWYDSASEYLYIADRGNHRIVKTKIDGTGWTTYGSGSIATTQGSFSYPCGMYYDSVNDYIYTTNTEFGNSSIIKTKIDGTGWVKYGTSGSGVGNFNNPRGIVFDTNSNYLYIADSANNRIVKTQIDGTGWITYGTNGSGTGNFSSPGKIIFDPVSSNLFVSDDGNGRIIKTQIDGTGWLVLKTGLTSIRDISYDPTTEFVYGVTAYDNRGDNPNAIVKVKTDTTGFARYGQHNPSTGFNKYPSGTVYDSTSKYIYYIDAFQNKIIRTKLDGFGFNEYGSYGSGVGQFNLYRMDGNFNWASTTIGYDPSTEFLYIADFNNHRIVKTKYDGTNWTSYGSSGSGVGKFSYPAATYYDPVTEYIYIADRNNNRIVKTKIDGTGWTTYGTSGSGVGNFSSPSGIWYDSANDFIYISDRGNNRVVKTQIDGTGWTSLGGFNTPLSISGDNATGYLYISDAFNNRYVKTQIDGTGWTTLGLSENAGTIYYDPTEDFIYKTSPYGNVVTKIKFNGTNSTSINGLWNKPLITSSGAKPLSFGVQIPSGRLYFQSSSGDLAHWIQSDPQTLVSGTWYDAKVTYNNTSGVINLYLNDVLVATTIDSSWTASANLGNYLYIGGDATATRNVFSSPIDNITLSTVTADTTPPTNPTTLTAKNHSGGNIDLVSGNWYNHSTPYFSWSGALDTGGSGIKDYLVYWGTNASADPRTDPAKTIQTGTTFAPTGLVDGTTYYLKVKARDMEYNVAEETWSPFTYVYLNSTPETPIANDPTHRVCVNATEDPCTGASPSTAETPSSLNRFSFTWTKPANKTEEQILRYRYAVNVSPLTAGNTSTTSLASLPAGAYATQQGQNTIRIVAEDKAGTVDYSAPLEISFYAQTTAPGYPENVLSFDSSNRATSEYAVTIKWTEPTVTGNNFAGYEIFRYTSGETNTCATAVVGDFVSIGTTSTTTKGFFDGGLTSQYYCYRVKSKDNAGQYSAASDVQTIKPTGAFVEPATMKLNSLSQTVGSSTLQVKWSTLETDHPCTPRVKVFSLDSDTILYDNNGTSSNVVDHTVDVIGLSSATDYRFKAYCADVDAKVMETDYTSFKTENSPALYDVAITDLTLTSAVANFKTASNSKSTKIIFSKDNKFANSTEYNLGTGYANDNQSVRFEGLSENTTYYFMINAITTANDSMIHSNSFTTPAKPVITNVQLQPVADAPITTYDVVWTSNVPISSSVTFSSSGKAPKSNAKADLETSHTLRVAGLEDQATYSITVSGRDQFGNVAEYTAPSVTTPIDTRKPSLINLTVEVRASGVGTSQKAQIIVSWETDEPSTSMVEYDQGITGDSYGFKSQQDATYTTSHVVILSELEPSKLYHLRAVSTDKAGNTGNSQDTSAITGKTQKSVVDLILNSLVNSFSWLGKIFK